MKITFCALAVILITKPLAYSQSNEPPPLSRVQWLNATCAEPVEFILNGTTLSKTWAPGQRIGTGNFPSLKWVPEFKQAEPPQTIREEIILKNGDSHAVILIGDFKETPEIELLQGKLPRGYSLSSDRKIVRAGIVNLPILKQKSKFYPVYLLNGIPEITVRAGIPGDKVVELEYGDLEFFMANPDTFPEIVLPGRPMPVSFELTNESRGGVFAFYKNKDNSKIEYAFLRLQSIESYQEYKDRIKRSQEAPSE